MKKIRIIASSVLIALVIFSLGIFVAVYQIQPYGIIQTFVKKAKGSQTDIVLEKEMNVLKLERQPLNVELANIRNLVKTFIPGIDQMSELGKIKTLRNLAHTEIQIGNKSVPYRYSMDPDLFVRLYLKDNSYSAACADIALAYHYLLMAFDISSNIVGLFSSVKAPFDSHVSVQVYSNEYGKSIISDPTFNIFVIDSATGIPMNYLGFKNAINVKRKYYYDTNGYSVAENRKVETYYIDYRKLLNYIYVDLWLNWDGSFEGPDQQQQNYLYQWRGMNHYLRDRNALFEGR